ncbi:hypothetical protein cpu_18170 [Carboxydothermus pertinax]|uniref:Uncharacterized protein n=1 Tax=Carboxydothermus pertinax TaxID=870242 RepID=A0A1L8CWN0_9THEO|nr:hypothetical protein cpu_18170 [Carboxydothermus pertinax]
MWDGNFGEIQLDNITYLSFNRTIVGWKRWNNGSIASYKLCFNRTIVGWKQAGIGGDESESGKF